MPYDFTQNTDNTTLYFMNESFFSHISPYFDFPINYWNLKVYTRKLFYERKFGFVLQFSYNENDELYGLKSMGC